MLFPPSTKFLTACNASSKAPAFRAIVTVNRRCLASASLYPKALKIVPRTARRGSEIEYGVIFSYQSFLPKMNSLQVVSSTILPPSTSAVRLGFGSCLTLLHRTNELKYHAVTVNEDNSIRCVCGQDILPDATSLDQDLNRGRQQEKTPFDSALNEECTSL